MHWDQNIIFIIIAAIVAISRLISRISEASKKQSQGAASTFATSATGSRKFRSPFSERRPKTDEERVLELPEALGQPAGAAPPPRGTATHANSTATCCTGPAAGFNAALR